MFRRFISSNVLELDEQQNFFAEEKEVKEMEKKGLLLLAGLFVLAVVACATTSSTPSLTASGSPGDVPSASAAVIGTPEAIETLLGKWSGKWEAVGLSAVGMKDADCSMVIKKVDLDQKIIEANYSWSWWRGAGEEDVRAEYLPPDKFKFRTKDQILLEYQLKDGVLWGTSQGYPAPQISNYPGKIKMTKIKE